MQQFSKLYLVEINSMYFIGLILEASDRRVLETHCADWKIRDWCKIMDLELSNKLRKSGIQYLNDWMPFNWFRILHHIQGLVRLKVSNLKWAWAPAMVTRSIGNYIATSQFQYDVLKEMSEFVLENLKSCRCLGEKSTRRSAAYPYGYNSVAGEGGNYCKESSEKREIMVK